MQPNQPYVSPPPPSPPSMPPGPQQPQPKDQQTQPNYDFLYQQPQKTRRLPFVGNSLAGRVLSILLGVLVLAILFAVVKSLITTQAFNKGDYQLLVERQQEMIHILTTDVSNNTLGQLSPSDQNFVATAKASLTTAQFKTLTFMNDYKDKVNTQQITTTFSNSIDQTLTSSLSTNTFDNAFKSVMKQQLDLYKQGLKTAYNSTTVSSGKSLLRNEYNEANLLINALGS